MHPLPEPLFLLQICTCFDDCKNKVNDKFDVKLNKSRVKLKRWKKNNAYNENGFCQVTL